jgi:hypothetical protein
VTVRDSDDEIDPDLVKIGRRLPIGPLFAASVLGFAVLMMVRLRHDFVFAGQPDEARDLGAIATLAGPLPNDAHVTLAGDPDGRAPARLRGQQDTGRRLAPFIGTAGRVWLNEPGEAIDVEPSYDGRFTGRLRRLDDTPFGDGLRELVAGLPPQPRFVFPDALGSGLPASDVHGEPLGATPESRLVVRERVLGAAVVTVVRTETLLDEQAARRALEAAGLAPIPVGTTDGESWTYEIASDAEPVRAKLREARLFSAGVEPKLVRHEGTVGAFRVDGDQVVLGDRRVPRAAVAHVAVYAPATIPADAWVLVSGDTPARLWYMRPLYGVLGVIALLMIWALVVDVRHLRKQRADSPV